MTTLIIIAIYLIGLGMIYQIFKDLDMEICWILLWPVSLLVLIGNKIGRYTAKIFLLLTLCLFGCGYSPADYTKAVIVTDIESSSTEPRFCFYYVYPSKNTRIVHKGYFADHCGKYTVGDTIKIVKQ